MRKVLSLTAMTVIASGCASVGEAPPADKTAYAAREGLQKSLAAKRERQEFHEKVKYKGSACIQGSQPFEVFAAKLIDALKSHEKQFNITIAKHVDEPGADVRFGEKYFLFTDNATGAQGLIDIHVIRNGEEICPKQDTDFKLVNMDKIVYVPVATEDAGHAPGKDVTDSLQRLPGVNISTSAAC